LVVMCWQHAGIGRTVKSWTITRGWVVSCLLSRRWSGWYDKRRGQSTVDRASTSYGKKGSKEVESTTYPVPCCPFLRIVDAPD
jgi:hypothetical protein